MNTKPALDADGIPILSDPLPEREIVATDALHLAERLSGLSTTAIVKALLDNDPFRQQLEELAGKLTRQIHEEMLQELHAALESAVSRVMEDCSTRSLDIVHQQLEASLPGLLARTFRQD
jgi:hypothetical protein